MLLKPAILTLSALLLLVVPAASADPPAGSTANCLGGGYNPNSLANVCTAPLLATPGSTGTIGTAPGPCVIGQTCVPIPTYSPNGGTPIPSGTVPAVSYTDVKVVLDSNDYVKCEAPFDFPSNPGLANCGVVVGSYAGAGIEVWKNPYVWVCAYSIVSSQVCA